MNGRKIFLGVAAGLAGAAMAAVLTPAVSAQLTVGEIQEKMLTSDQQLSSLKIEYAQKMTSSLTAETKESSGKAFLRKPRELRIEQSNPESQLIVSSGKNVFIYTPRFRQVVKDSWQRWSDNQFLLPGVSGFGQTLDRLKKDYNWEVLGSAEIKGVKTILVRMTRPGNKDGEKLKVWISESDFIPRRTELVMGTLKMTTEVTSIELNPVLDSGLFRFQQPKDANVIQAP